MTDDPFLRAFAETRAFLLGRPGRFQLTSDGRAVLFLRSGPRDPTLGLFEQTVATGEARELVTPAELLAGGEEVLSEAEQARRERLRISERGFTQFALSPDGATVLLPLSGRLFLFERTTRRARELPLPAGSPVVDPRFSPDGALIAFVRDHDLWVVEAGGGAPPRRLTWGGSDDLLHGEAEFVAQEEMHRLEGYWWAPDGRALAYAEVDQRAVERFAIADPFRPERPPGTFAYPRPGKANARVRLGIVPAGGGETVWARWDQARWPYLARVLWERRSPLAVLLQSRDQREAALLAVDPASGETRTLVEERDEAWVNLERDLPRWLPDGGGLLWATEASGHRALELRAPDGARLGEVIPADAGFLQLVHVTPDGREVTALVGGPLTNRIQRFPVRGGAPAALTGDEAEHAPVFARDGASYVDSVTSAGELPRSFLVRADGTRVEVPATAEAPPFRVNLALETVEVEGRIHHAALVRPRAFEPGRRYPVIVHVYGGPHALIVKADQRQYLLSQWLADRGAIVVAIDNRGTPRRGRAWERVIKGDFGAVPLADQVGALQALGARHPELDLARVGIHGWSFGGYMAALAVLRRPDVYKVAVAGAPVVDWLDYDTHYTERYLDLPEANPEGYAASSLLRWAPGLSRPLLLVHGTADDNVYFFHSLKLADALTRAGRSFDFLPLPGVTHQVPEPVVRARLWERIADYLFSRL